MQTVIIKKDGKETTLKCETASFDERGNTLEASSCSGIVPQSGSGEYHVSIDGFNSSYSGGYGLLDYLQTKQGNKISLSFEL